MQITQIECKIGVTLNMGDFKSLRADFGMTADLDRNEDEATASAALRTKVMANLLAMGTDAHPDRVRGLVEGNAQAALPAPEAKKEPAKRGPKPKDTGGNGASAAQTTSATAASPSEPTLADELGDSIPASGGGGLGEDDGEDLLGDAAPEITLDVLKAKLRDVLNDKTGKGGKATMLELFKKVGATDLQSVPNTKYQELFAMASKALAG